MNVMNFTYTELNKMFGELIEQHENDTEFFSEGSAKKYADDELISGDFLCVQNAYDELCATIDGFAKTFEWSCGIRSNEYDVGLVHIDAIDYETCKCDTPMRHSMIKAEIIRRIPVIQSCDFIGEVERIIEEMECVFL